MAKDAGVTVPTAIRRYGTKEQLRAATARREVQRIAAARARPAFADPDTAVAALCEYYEADGDLIARFEAEAALAPALAELARAGRAVHIRWIEEVFTAQLLDDRERRTTGGQVESCALPSSAERMAAASIAVSSAARTRWFSSSRMAAIVVPPGDVTASRRITGCSPESRSIVAAPTAD